MILVLRTKPIQLFDAQRIPFMRCWLSHYVFTVVLVAQLAFGAPPTTSDSSVDVQMRTVSLLEGVDHSVAVSAKLEIGKYARDQTLAALTQNLEAEHATDFRTSPEGIECLAEAYRVQSNPDAVETGKFLDLCSPTYRLKLSKTLIGHDKDPALPPMRPLHLARFGLLTAMILEPVSPGGLFSGMPFMEMMTQRGDDFELVNSSPINQEFATRCFISIVSNFDDSDYVARDLTKDPKYSAIALDYRGTGTEKHASDSEMPRIYISVLTSPLKEGPTLVFFNQVIATLANGSDDQIKALFDDRDPLGVEDLFGTANDLAILQALRDDVRSGHLAKSITIAGSSATYIVFTMTEPSTSKGSSDSPSTQLSDNERVFILRCATAAGKIKLTGSRNRTLSEPVEQILGDHSFGALMSASEVCRRLMDAIPER